MKSYPGKFFPQSDLIPKVFREKKCCTGRIFGNKVVVPMEYTKMCLANIQNNNMSKKFS
jgi:hypothetical protein